MISIKPNNEGGTWHTGYTFGGSYSYCKLTGVKTGCGLMQLSGYVNLLHSQVTDDELSEAFNYVKGSLINDGVGAVMATNGSDYEDDEATVNFLKKAGFEEVCSYNNYLHGSNYIQRLYICKL